MSDNMDEMNDYLASDPLVVRPRVDALEKKLNALQEKLKTQKRKAEWDAFIKAVPALTPDEQVELYNALVTAMAAR